MVDLLQLNAARAKDRKRKRREMVDLLQLNAAKAKDRKKGARQSERLHLVELNHANEDGIGAKSKWDKRAAADWPAPPGCGSALPSCSPPILMGASRRFFNPVASLLGTKVLITTS